MNDKEKADEIARRIQAGQCGVCGIYPAKLYGKEEVPLCTKHRREFVMIALNRVK